MTRARTLIIAATVALVLGGCTSIGSDPTARSGSEAEDSTASTQPDAVEGGRVTVAVDQGWDAYNSDTSTGRGPWNFGVDAMTRSSFWQLAPDGSLTPNPLMGHYEVVAQDPLTVEYTINDDAVWSDGEPIGYADVLLDWAARSGTLQTAEGEPLFDSVRIFDGQPSAPEGEVGEQTFTLAYQEPTGQWERGIEALLPAHVAAEQGGLSVDELVEAIRTEDVDALGPVAEFWNTGWQYSADSPVPEESLIPSSGPYQVAERDGSSLILERNERYWGPAPHLDQIVLRTLDPSEHAQALINGEVDIVKPQALLDVYEQLSTADGISVLTGDQFAYVHADFRMDSPVFQSRETRQAFAHCIPRQEIVDRLIAPVQPDSQVLDLRELYPFQPEYEAVLGEVPSAAEYAETDVEKAASLLERSGPEDPEVTIVLPDGDKRLAEAAALIAESCGHAGFSVEWEPVPSIGDRISGEAWDIALFEWASAGQLGASQYLYGTAQPGNFAGYSDPDVDQLLAELGVSTDRGQMLHQQGQLEEALWADMVTMPLYAQPQIVAVRDRVHGVQLHAWPAGLTTDAASWSLTE